MALHKAKREFSIEHSFSFFFWAINRLDEASHTGIYHLFHALHQSTHSIHPEPPSGIHSECPTKYLVSLQPSQVDIK